MRVLATALAAVLVGALAEGRFSEAVIGEEVRTALRHHHKNATACWKEVEFRGLGHISKTCEDGEEKQAGICYKDCDENFEGVGPICLSGCPAELPLNAGFICCRDKDVCSQKVIDLAVKIPYEIARAVMDESNPVALINDLKEIFHDALELAFPECAHVSTSLTEF